MTRAALALLLALACVLSWALTGLARRYALAHGVLDHPNERSLHERPTPRIGGIAIVSVVLAYVLGAGVAGWLEPGLAIGFGGAGLLIASTGWIDDHRGVPRGVRLALHTLAAGWAVAWAGGMPSLDVGTAEARLGAAGAVLAVLATVWSINFYNFMDGADGVAAGEAVSVGTLAGALLLWPGDSAAADQLAALTLVVAAAALGFLFWNWHPARIFMGDTASGFLGLVFAALAVASENRDALPALVWLLLIGVFFVDATATLARRIARGERWREAHRRHAYQRLVRAGLGHGRVAGWILGVNAALGGLAWLAVARPAWLAPIAVGGLLALLALYAALERAAPWELGASRAPAAEPHPGELG